MGSERRGGGAALIKGGSQNQQEVFFGGTTGLALKGEAKNIDTDKTGVRDCIGREKVWYVSGINS